MHRLSLSPPTHTQTHTPFTVPWVKSDFFFLLLFKQPNLRREKKSHYLSERMLACFRPWLQGHTEQTGEGLQGIFLELLLAVRAHFSTLSYR